MSHGLRSLRPVLFSALAAWGLGGCGERASGEAGRPGRGARTPCPTVEQVGEAAGFPVTFTSSIGYTPDIWIVCQYQMTGRHRGNFLQLTGDPAAKADSVFADMRQAVKGMNGVNAELDRIDIGSPGWAYGSNSLSEAAAVIGSHVWHARLEYLLSTSIGDQKEAMIRLVELVAR